MNRTLAVATLLAGLAATACHKQETQVMYEKLPVERRDIIVTASATGAIEPVLTVDVKSKASGEITDMRVQTGDDVRAGQLLVVVDPRQPKNALDQAQANLEVAQAQLQNAKAAMDRADTLYKAQALTETEFEAARLTYANARAAVVRAQADLDNARDAMEDTRLKAPVAGTIIAKNVELGTVISSPTRDVGGGTVLFKMANLDTVQIRTLVDETDIGKIKPGMEATITVDAYPNRPFQGAVLKIEPQATVQQNVTMFPVLVRIVNPEHLLKPGMNTEVEVHVGQARGVVAVPYAALRTQRDVTSAAEVLGLDPQAVQQQLAQARQPQAGRSDSASLGGGQRGDTALRPAPAQGVPTGATPSATISTPDGRTITVPGVTQKEADQAQAAMRKRMTGGEPTPEEQAVMRKVFGAMRAAGGGGFGRPGGGNGGFNNRRNLDTGNYIVFALKNGTPTAVPIRTGLTDLDYIEVLSGLSAGDTVLVLPTSGMLSSQREMRERFQRMTGGGLPGVQQTPAAPPRTTTTPR
jgi:HlyD family secretion protein